MSAIVWEHDGVRIPEIARVDLHNADTPIYGNGAKNANSRDMELVTWIARVTPRGWSVEVVSLTGRRTMYEGPTFNLLLEVATAIRRH